MPRQTSIMLVDDDQLHSHAIRRYLERRGYGVTYHASGDAALADFRSARPDLVLLDVMMPGLDGWEVCRRMRGLSSVPIVMVSAQSNWSDVEAAMQAGVDDYLIKPVGLKDLALCVERVVRRHGSLEKVAVADVAVPAGHPVRQPSLTH